MLPIPGQVSYIRQQKPLGLGHAVWCARHLVGDEPFAVLLADDLILSKAPCLGQMLDVYNKTGGNIVASMEVIPEHTSRYGIISPGAQKSNVIEVQGLIEKPNPKNAPSPFAVIGRYILDPSVFQHLEKGETGAGGEIQLTDALAKMIGHKPFHAVLFEGERFDCGDKVGFLEANIAFALERSEMQLEVRQILGKYSK